MKLENQVCSFKQSYIITELGIRYLGHAALLWVNHGSGWRLWPNGYVSTTGDERSVVPAFTVAELGQMLPNGYDTMRTTGDEGGDVWRAYGLDFGDVDPGASWVTEAEARADVLIHLLETNQLTAEEANKRLMQ